MIIVDNVGRGGRVADESITDDASVNGVRELLRYIKTSDNVDAVTTSTVGDKGWDGFIYALRL